MWKEDAHSRSQPDVETLWRDVFSPPPADLLQEQQVKHVVQCD